MDINDCKKKGFIKKSIPNKELAKSLIEMSDLKEKVISQQIMTEETISAFFPIAYDSLREIMEALCILNGYKVTNHICLGELVYSICSDFNLVLFDRIRYARNSINYYGEKIDCEQGKELISKLFELKIDVLATIKTQYI